jgi:hypothetical protein
MKKLLLSSILLLSVGCALETASDVDELAAEDADLGELGAADAAGGLYTYYELRQDFRRCIYPLCGGVWVSRVNRAQTQCADGRNAPECYVAEVDLAALGLSEDEAAAVRGDISLGRAIIRGTIARRTIGSYDSAALVASEAWTAPADFAPVGVFVRVTDSGIRCITYPCTTMHEEKLNSSLDAMIAGLDFTPSGASDEQVAAAFEGLAESGLLVAGYRYYERGPAGRAAARTVTAFWTRVVHREVAAGGCFVGGCSSHVCSDDEGLITTCEWRPHYACYATATCERQADGHCGWTETPELDACLAGSI